MKVIYLTDEYVYINENDRVVRKEFSYEKGIITASIGYSHILNMTFKLQKTIEKEMLEIEAEKYIFTEGSLDYSKEYKINYFFKEYEDYYNVEAFIIEIDKIKNEFEKYLKTYKYIDFISPKPIVFKAYYDITNLPPSNEVFIYFDKNEAFLSCFENGEFVFVKSLTKLSTLSQQLNKELDEVIDLLNEKGLNESLYEDKEVYSTIDSFFSQFFMKVNNLINYSISYYALSKIEKIHFYSPFEIKNLLENYKDFWNLSGIEFKKYEVASDYDAFDYTAVIFNSKNYENENLNFSIFPKPLPIYRTRAGILLITVTLLILILAGDFYYKNEVISEQKSQISRINYKLKRKQRLAKLLKLKIDKYKKEIKELQKENKALQMQISDIEDKITFLYPNLFKSFINLAISEELLNLLIISKSV